MAGTPDKDMHCTSCKKPDKENLIMMSKFWIVTLSGSQLYLGRSYITAKRHCGSLSELTLAEWRELNKVIRTLESAMKKAFNATMFNWTCLMNMAYQESPPNPHVHWHFRPRYDHTVTVAGTKFSDPEFGHHYNKDRKQRVTPKIKKAILLKIQQHLNYNSTVGR